MSAPYTATLSRFLLHLATSYVIMPMALHERQAVGHTTRKGVRRMRITLHIGRYTVTIIVKSRNRHSAK